MMHHGSGNHLDGSSDAVSIGEPYLAFFSCPPQLHSCPGMTENELLSFWLPFARRLN